MLCNNSMSIIFIYKCLLYDVCIKLYLCDSFVTFTYIVRIDHDQNYIEVSILDNHIHIYYTLQYIDYVYAVMPSIVFRLKSQINLDFDFIYNICSIYNMISSYVPISLIYVCGLSKHNMNRDTDVLNFALFFYTHRSFQ